MKLPVIFTVIVLVVFSSRVLAAPSLEDIVKALEKADRKIDAVKVEGDWHMYQWDDPTKSWKTTPVSSTFTCAIENKPQGRYVFDEHPHIARWTDGTAPYLASWSTQFRDSDGVITDWHYKPNLPYDGTQFLAGPTCFRDRADREKKSGFYHALAQRVEGIYSGLGFTGLRAIRNTPIHVSSMSNNFTVSESPDGLVRVRFSVAVLPAVTWDYVLDPNKDFALVRYAYSQQGGYSYTDEVLEHRQIAGGVWYPARCTKTTSDSKEELVLTKIDLLHGGDAETNLTVKLPDAVEIRAEDAPSENVEQGASAPRR
ncbi:MAG: hypothetical protein ABSG14_10875 [Verrucomicrobiia bacterium]|jgi:hypothetical protein